MNRPPGQHGEDVKETEEWEAGKDTPVQHHEDPDTWPEGTQPYGTHGDGMMPADDPTPKP